MSKYSTRALSLGVALLTAVASASALSAQSKPTSTAAARMRTDSIVPIAVFEEDLVYFVREPVEHLISARALLERGERTNAAQEVAAAAAYVRLEAGTATGVNRADLQESARDLDRIAAQIRSRNVHSARELDGALRRTEQALGRHHLERAVRAWERKETAKAGHELRGATEYTSRLARAGGKDVERGTADVIRAARLVSGKLIEGTGWATDEVGKAFSGLGRELDRLGADVVPSRSR